MIRRLKIVLFIIVILGISFICGFALRPSSYMRVVFHDVKSEAGYNMIFVGQSRGETNIDPYVLDSLMEYKTYNLCRRFVQLPDIRYVISEANSNDTIQVAVLDVDQLYFYNTDIDYFGDAFMYPHISNVPDKLRYTKSLLNKDFRILLMRYTVEGMDDLKESKERIKDKLSEGYKAYSFDAVTNKNSHHIYMGRGYWKGVQMSDKTIEGSAWNKDLISIDAIRCVADMADYCKKEGIIMLAIHAPVPHERFTEEEHYSQKEYFEDMFGEYGVKYIDFNFIKEDFLTWNEDGYTDLEGHMMGKMADEYSKVLGMVLNDYLSGRDIDEYFDDFPNMGD